MRHVLIASGTCAALSMLLSGPAFPVSLDVTVILAADDHRCVLLNVVSEPGPVSLYDFKRVVLDAIDLHLAEIPLVAPAKVPYFYAVLESHGEKPRYYLRV